MVGGGGGVTMQVRTHVHANAIAHVHTRVHTHAHTCSHTRVHAEVATRSMVPDRAAVPVRAVTLCDSHAWHRWGGRVKGAWVPCAPSASSRPSLIIDEKGRNGRAAGPRGGRRQLRGQRRPGRGREGRAVAAAAQAGGRQGRAGHRLHRRIRGPSGCALHPHPAPGGGGQGPRAQVKVRRPPAYARGGSMNSCDGEL